MSENASQTLVGLVPAGERGVDLFGWVVRVRGVGIGGRDRLGVLVGCADDSASVLVLSLTVRIRGAVLWEIVDVCAVSRVCRWWEVLPELASELLVSVGVGGPRSCVSRSSGWWRWSASWRVGRDVNSSDWGGDMFRRRCYRDMLVLLCSIEVAAGGVEQDMLCIGRLFCMAAFACGHVGCDRELRGLLSRSFRLESLLAGDCFDGVSGGAAGECCGVYLYSVALWVNWSLVLTCGFDVKYDLGAGPLFGGCCRSC